MAKAKKKSEKIDVRKYPFFADGRISDLGVIRLNNLPEIVKEDLKKLVLAVWANAERIAADILAGSTAQGVKTWIESHRS